MAKSSASLFVQAADAHVAKEFGLSGLEELPLLRLESPQWKGRIVESIHID